MFHLWHLDAKITSEYFFAIFLYYLMKDDAALVLCGLLFKQYKRTKSHRKVNNIGIGHALD